MQRRTFFTAAAATAMLARPALATAPNALRFVPQASLGNMDPIWGTQMVVRNAAMLVWDTLYGMDANLVPRRQMVESEEVSPDGLTWRFRLREGLRFHDGEPVLARDAVASLDRWAARDSMGQMIRARQQELVAVDDREFRWTLRQPFPRMLQALAKIGSPCTFVMPERIARTDPFRQIGEIVGSGPLRFEADAWVPGVSAAFRRFEQYRPREEAASWLAGGKRMKLDRVEWIVMPDAATAAAALQNGEVDWWETPLPDLVPHLQSRRDLRVDIADPLGNVGVLRMNCLHPPFDDARIRRAVMTAIDQADYMQAVAGSDTAMWRRMPSYFTPGTPLYTEAGGEILRAGPKLDTARRMLAEAGYDGRPVVMLVAQDNPITKAHGDVTGDLLRRIGMNVRDVATDWGTVATRRASREPVEKGGWSIFFTWFSGVDCANPAGYNGLRGHGSHAWFGWPSVPGIEAARDAWFLAGDAASEKAAIDRLSRAAMEGVPYIPTGFFLSHQAWRSGVTGIEKAPLPLFWNVSKA